MNSQILLASLQAHLQRRGIELERVSLPEMVQAMVDWYRTDKIAIAGAGAGAQSDTLLYRYGGWSEGCATGFKLSLLRQVRSREEGANAEWIAGITLMFDPSRFGDLAPFSTIASEWQSLDAFLRAIESSRGYKLVVADAPMGAMLEIGGLR